MVCHQDANPVLEGLRCRLAELQAKSAQRASQTQLDVMKLALQQFASAQQGPGFLRRHRFAVHRTEPAHADQMREQSASLRSVLTGISLKALRTCPVSSSSIAGPACFMPANSHCESGPASSPIRAISKPRSLHHAVKASGSLATLASRTIRPVASTTQMLELSSDTSIPA